MLDKNELIEFKKILALGGFKTYKSAYFDSENYKRLRAVFLDNLPKINIEYPNIKYCSLSKVKQAGKEVINKHTNNIDIKVPYSFEDELESALIETFGPNPKEDKIDEVIEFVQNNMELKKITDIPLFSDLPSNRNGYTAYSPFYKKFQNLKYYEKLPHIIVAIGLKGPSDDFAKGIYVHEMYHALSKRNKGYTNNYLYDETLSIFMERVAALDINENLVNPAILRRTLAIKDDIINLTHNEFYEESYNSIIEPKKYILSFLLATSLFNTYIHSSTKGKRQIDNEINKVLMGYQQLEDILEKYEITEEKGSSIVKRQIKTIKHHKKY